VSSRFSSSSSLLVQISGPCGVPRTGSYTQSRSWFRRCFPVVAGRSSSPPDLVWTLRPHLRLRGEFLRLLELSTVSLVLPIMLAALTAVVLCRASSPAQYGGTPVPSQRPFGCPRSSASGAPCARPGSPHVVSSVLAGRPLCSRSSSIFILECSFQFAPSSGSISVLAHVIQHPNEQPSGNIPSPSTVRF
jgi:hypothetical protein